MCFFQLVPYSRNARKNMQGLSGKKGGINTAKMEWNVSGIEKNAN